MLCVCGSDGEEENHLEILMEAPEGFRNSDEDGFSDSQVGKMLNITIYIHITGQKNEYKQKVTSQ